MTFSLPRAVSAALIAALASGAAAAQGRGTFDGLQGTWSGTGTVTTSAGTERIRCRASYSGGGDSVRQNLRCASDSYNVDLRAELQASGGSLSGQWSESSRGVGGAVSGRASPGRIDAQVGGPGFNASIGVSTSGNRQQITIRSTGGEVSSVSIALSK